MYPSVKHGPVANVVPAADFQNVRAQLEDTQESLAAAFARIEVFRMREKLLVAEMAKLRLGDQPNSEGAAAAAADTDGTAAGAVAATTVPGRQQPSSSQPEQQQQQQQQPPLPCYITEVADHLPVMLISSGGRKTPGSIVITKDYVDFVEVRARVKRNELVGFTSAPAAPGHARRSQTSSSFSATWKQFLPSCLSPEPGSPRGHSRAAASDSAAHPHPAAEGGRGSSAVELAVVEAGGSPSTAAAASSWAHSPVAGSLSPRTGSHYNNSPSPAAAWYPQQPEQQQHHQQQQHELLGVGPWVCSGTAAADHSEGSLRGTGTGVWQILWRSGGMQQHLAFEATQEARQVLHKHTAKWLHGSGNYSDDHEVVAAVAAGAGAAAAAAAAAGPPGGPGQAQGPSGDGAPGIAVPKHLEPGSYTPRLSEPSSIISSGSSSSGLAGGRSGSPSSSSGLVDGLSHVAGALPARYQSRDWQLLYATARHGISLHTLYRRAAGQPATVLLVRDAGGYVFGAFCLEPWRPSPRFFGTGETFVFQLAPHKVKFPWQTKCAMKNDFFMYAQQEALAVGGLGAFAIWLDAELLQGSSGCCGTFGSPCLASKEEFKVAAVELWALQ